MRITRATEYAVRCVLYVSTRPKGNIVSRKEISSRMGIPEQFLGKIARLLSRAGIFEIVQGARGGYRLLKDPAELSLLDVTEAIAGVIFLNDCLMRPESCIRSSNCAVNRVWERARDGLRETLRAARFSDLASQEVCSASALPVAEVCGEKQ